MTRHPHRLLALVAVLVLALLSGCGKDGCSSLPVTSGIQVQVPPALQKLVGNIQVGLCQGEKCQSFTFPSRTEDPDGKLSAGVLLTGDAYDIDLDQLGEGWKAGTSSTLSVQGLSKSGRRTVFDHDETFTFEAGYPNGEDCDDAPALRHSTSVGGDDLVG